MGWMVSFPMRCFNCHITAHSPYKILRETPQIMVVFDPIRKGCLLGIWKNHVNRIPLEGIDFLKKSLEDCARLVGIKEFRIELGAKVLRHHYFLRLVNLGEDGLHKI